MAKPQAPERMLPAWQGAALQGAALVALVAVECAGMAYAMQSASTAQVLDLGGGWRVQTDVVLKCAMSIAAGLSLAYGPTIALHLWRQGAKRKRNQAILAIAASLVGFLVSLSNLSGYSAWTRDGREIETTRENPLYAVAASNAARVQRGELSYLSGADQRILREGQAQTTAQRSLGDVIRSSGILLLVAGMATAYRLPRQDRQKKPARRKQTSPPAANDGVTQLRRGAGG